MVGADKLRIQFNSIRRKILQKSRNIEQLTMKVREMRDKMQSRTV